MATPEFQTDELVDVTIKGVRFGYVDNMTGCTSIFDDGNTYRLPHQAEITRAAPVGWPPRHQDVWIDRDREAWMADGADRLFNPDAGYCGPSTALDTCGPLALIWRDGQPFPAPTSVDPEKLARLLCRTSYEVRGSAEAAETWDMVSDAIRAEYRQEADALLRLCIVTPRQDGGGS